MSLVADLMAGALDPGYADVARRRAERGEESRGVATGSRAGLLTLGLIVVGLLLATAAVQTRNRAPAAAQTKAELIREVRVRTAATDRLARDLDQLRQRVDNARSTGLSLTSEGAAAARRLQMLELATGSEAVHGPGVLVHIVEPAHPSPAADAAGADATTEDGRVLDQDLQTVVNALWAAGAEAISIDGQRLTSLSAIRSAGEAVLVNYRPLSPPYDIAAIGPSDLAQSFADSVGGRYLKALETYGITSAVTPQKDVHVAAATDLGLDQVRVTTPHAATPAATPSGKATP
jgi:uncharacterized protein YlxW (UPF0749 family)